MAFINTRHARQRVSFSQAVRLGIGQDQGLFLPEQLRPLKGLDSLMDEDFPTRSSHILSQIVGPELPRGLMEQVVESAFNFPAPLRQVSDRVFALELFHGTSLAFKDFGARFMAHFLSAVRTMDNDQGQMTILTATSGDTGAAVAQAFFNLPGINVVVLYPKGRITPLQEKLFCTLGGNIRTFAVEADFDACQALVKQSFLDERLVAQLGLNSANSINIARLLAQVCYYFEAVAQLPRGTRPVFSVPSGNFGNVTAGLIASAIGLPASRFIAATNSNDTVPRFLADGHWNPRPTIATVTNAMDVSQPNNFERILALDGERYGVDLQSLLSSEALSDDDTRAAIRSLHQQGYLADPHSALAWQVLQKRQRNDETGVFLCTAHPAKFLEEIESTLNIKVDLPRELQAVINKDLLSESIPDNFEHFKQKLLN